MGELMGRLHVLTFAVWLTGCGSVTALGNDGGAGSGGDDSGDGGGGSDAGTGSDGGMDSGIDGGLDIDAGGRLEFLSCSGLPSTCGFDNQDSCCSSAAVPAGTYRRSYDVAADPNSGTTNFPATVSGFRLDRYEITVGRFRAFVEMQQGTQASPPVTEAGAHRNITGSGWSSSWNASLVADKAALIAAVKCDPDFQTWTDAPGANETRPMNCITWFEAMAFCVWDGGYLPTEAEWNYAAAAGDEQRAYPWSNPAATLGLDASRASYTDGVSCVGDNMPDCALTDLVPVGSKPTGDGRWGQADLSGNVFEWTLDWAAQYASGCIDCANLAVATSREIRGGSFATGPVSLRTGARLGAPPSRRVSFTGARCARTP